jgi:predicted Abi (CAAX) family protease
VSFAVMCLITHETQVAGTTQGHLRHGLLQAIKDPRARITLDAQQPVRMYCCWNQDIINTVSSPMNMIGQSQSGTGKTAAFVLTMLSRIDFSKNQPQVRVHTPIFDLCLIDSA